jgi:hypothetical protein
MTPKSRCEDESITASLWIVAALRDSDVIVLVCCQAYIKKSAVRRPLRGIVILMHILPSKLHINSIFISSIVFTDPNIPSKKTMLLMNMEFMWSLLGNMCMSITMPLSGLLTALFLM